MIGNLLDCGPAYYLHPQRQHTMASTAGRASSLPLWRFVALIAMTWAGLSIFTFVHLPAVSMDPEFLRSALSSSTAVDCTGHTHTWLLEPPPLPLPTNPVMYTLPHPPPSDYHILHTITSRFMVGQPHQSILAKARYQLLETFCWPTLQHQTRRNFFWLLLVDPGLDAEVLQNIRTLLQETTIHNKKDNTNNLAYYMVMTNNTVWAADGVGVPGVNSYGVGLQELGREYRAGRVEITTGDTTHLLRALDQIEGRTTTKSSTSTPSPSPLILLIETLLDADDGLHSHGVEWIQEVAVQHANRQLELMGRHRRPNISLNHTWWLMCGTDHIEWHNRDIFQLTQKEYDDRGLTSGITGIRHAPIYCASAGYTRVGLTQPAATFWAQDKSGGGAAKKEMPLLMFPRVAYSNHALTDEFPVCNDGLQGIDGPPKASGSSPWLPFPTTTKNNGNNHTVVMSQCFRREFPDFPFVLKSRTITSDSMDHMNPKLTDYRDLPWHNETEFPLWVNETEKTWLILRNEFGIDRVKAWKTSMYLREHMDAILQQNREARCAPGFPCREVAEKQFQKMGAFVKQLNRKNEMEAKAGGTKHTLTITHHARTISKP